MSLVYLRRELRCCGGLCAGGRLPWEEGKHFAARAGGKRTGRRPAGAARAVVPLGDGGRPGCGGPRAAARLQASLGERRGLRSRGGAGRGGVGGAWGGTGAAAREVIAEFWGLNFVEVKRVPCLGAASAAVALSVKV